MSDNNALEQAKAQLASIIQMVNALEVDYDRLEELRDLESNNHLDVPEQEELAELEEAADGCDSEDGARERILDDPLTVEVREGWHAPGDTGASPEEFQILLCTGGPAVRIFGELDEYCQPKRAWIQYQDWGTPWTEYITSSEEDDAVLTYCQQFYFGG